MIVAHTMILRTTMVIMISLIGMEAEIAPQDFMLLNNTKALPNRQPTAFAPTTALVITRVHRRIDTGTPQGPKHF